MDDFRRTRNDGLLNNVKLNSDTATTITTQRVVIYKDWGRKFWNNYGR